MMGAMYAESNMEKRNSPSLASQVVMWPTPTTAEAGKISCCPNYGQLGLSNHPDVHGYQVNRPKLEKSRSGQAAPANPSTHGNRQESWETPTVSTGAHQQADGSMTPKLDQQVKQWATPNTMDHMEPRPVEAMKRMLDHGQRKNRKWSSNVREQVVWDQKYAASWATPKASDPQHSGPNMRDSAGNYALPAQAVRASLATGKLNPRWVETLMGLPVGWTMPSCASPVTIAPTNCDYSETESSQLPQPELF